MFSTSGQVTKCSQHPIDEDLPWKPPHHFTTWTLIKKKEDITLRYNHLGTQLNKPCSDKVVLNGFKIMLTMGLLQPALTVDLLWIATTKITVIQRSTITTTSSTYSSTILHPLPSIRLASSTGPRCLPKLQLPQDHSATATPVATPSVQLPAVQKGSLIDSAGTLAVLCPVMHSQMFIQM